MKSKPCKDKLCLFCSVAFYLRLDLFAFELNFKFLRTIFKYRNMDHILVEWVGETPRQFSVCKRTDIVDGEFRDQGINLIGRSLLIQWKRREFMGKVLKLGSEEDLEKEADDLATAEHLKEVAPSTNALKPKGQRRNRKTIERMKTKSSVAEVLAALPNVNTAVCNELLVCGNGDEEIITTDYKAKYKALKTKYRDLKARFKILSEQANTELMIELMPETGVRMKKADIDRMKLVSSQVTVFARNLFRHFFTSEDLSTHSLYGKQCNANKSSCPPLPPIDEVKRDAIISFILKENGLDTADCASNKELVNKRKGVKREITKTLSDFLREEHKKARTANDN